MSSISGVLAGSWPRAAEKRPGAARLPLPVRQALVRSLRACAAHFQENPVPIPGGWETMTFRLAFRPCR
jgi:hypothetical protein